MASSIKTNFLSFIFFLLLSYIAGPLLIRWCFQAYGSHIRRKTSQRKEFIIERTRADQKEYDQANNLIEPFEDDWEKVDKSRRQSDADVKPQSSSEGDWQGVVGFFHPFCNAGGGGERVLWAAIKATQQKWPNAICVVYTGDHDVGKEDIISRVQERFNIQLHPPTLMFLYLSTRHYVLSSTWPHFTLAGQSLGSVIVAHDAFTNLLVPDIFIDTMGYAFAVGYCKLLFPDVPTAAYVHYPTISTDMLDSLDSAAPDHGIHAGAGSGWQGRAKKAYWRAFAALYGRVGGTIDVVMTNSSWTHSHISTLWGPSRAAHRKPHPLTVLFPPVAVSAVTSAIPLPPDSDSARQPELLCIAQFRPEKNHALILRAFARFLHHASPPPPPSTTLTLVGSVRDSADETHIYSLRLLAHELRVTERVTFLLNAAWPAVLARLRAASVGVNAMWNEHFGIGVVEYQAAGLLCVVNDSGGPKLDIVVDAADGPTGFRAATEEEYAKAFETALVGLAEGERVAMRRRARRRAWTFDEAAFEAGWVVQMGRVVDMAKAAKRAPA